MSEVFSSVKVCVCVCFPSNLHSVFAEEEGSGVQDVRGVRGVVVRVGRVVAGLHELQPRAQRGLGAVEELAHAEAGEDLQPEVRQRSAGVTHRRSNLTSYTCALTCVLFLLPVFCTRCVRCKS